MKKTILLCTGLSGSGKSHFIDNYLLQQPGQRVNLKKKSTKDTLLMKRFKNILTL